MCWGTRGRYIRWFLVRQHWQILGMRFYEFRFSGNEFLLLSAARQTSGDGLFWQIVLIFRIFYILGDPWRCVDFCAGWIFTSNKAFQQSLTLGRCSWSLCGVCLTSFFLCRSYSATGKQSRSERPFQILPPCKSYKTVHLLAF